MMNFYSDDNANLDHIKNKEVSQFSAFKMPLYIEDNNNKHKQFTLKQISVLWNILRYGDSQ